MIKTIANDENDLINKLMSLIEQFANKAIEDGSVFNIGLSGGSLVRYLSIGLQKVKTDFSKWRIFFCDERIVPEDDPESTFGTYKSELMEKLNLTDEQFVKVKQGATAVEAAEDYAKQLSEFFPNQKTPRFDLLLLGMGPDGHTASLFPDHKLLEEKNLWVAAIEDSPKPPACRITLTVPVLNHAKCCIFAVGGAAKAETVKRILVDKEELPAALVKPTAGFLYWILDKEAAQLVN